MSVYILLMAAVTALATVTYYCSFQTVPVNLPRKYKGNAAYLLAIFLLILVSAIRFEVGTDYNNYKVILSRSDGFSIWEPAFAGLARMTQSLTLSYELFIALNSLIVVVIFCAAYRRNIQFHPLSVFLFLAMGTYFQTFCLLRQAIGMAIVFWGYPYLCKNQYVRLLITMVVAYCFHSSALMLLPVMLLANMRLTKKYYMIWTIFGLGIGVVVSFLARWFIHVRYLGYHDKEMDPMLAIYSVLLGVIIFALSMIYRDRLLARDKNNNILINIAFFYLLYAFGLAFVPVISRVFQYFIPFLGMLITQIVLCEQNKRQQRFFAALVMAGYFAFMCILVMVSTMGVYPYQTLWG